MPSPTTNAAARHTRRSNAKLERTAFKMSRLLDFCSRKELIAQVGHQPDTWPLVLVKELLDNSLDACEDSQIAPEITVRVDGDGVTVQDNGPGIPADVVAGVLDFSIRVSTKEAYVSPCRGSQGHALKAVACMGFVLDGQQGRLLIEARGVRHDITMRVDRLRQQPVIDHQQQAAPVPAGTKIQVFWPATCASTLTEAKPRFLQIADDFTYLNPHLRLTLDWFGDAVVTEATDPTWAKWRPSDPTCVHWYGREHFERLVSAYIADDADHGRQRLVREFVSEFRGLSGSAKQKAVLDACGLSRTALAKLADGDRLNGPRVSRLLEAMQAHSKPVKPPQLGVIGKAHLARRCEALGVEMETFDYQKLVGHTGAIPAVIEAAFAWARQAETRRLICGVNWSAAVSQPFRELGVLRQSLDSILAKQWAGYTEPVVMILHVAAPRLEFRDRAKSSVALDGYANDDE
jgi:DNA topoisomerase VI subunit B